MDVGMDDMRLTDGRKTAKVTGGYGLVCGDDPMTPGCIYQVRLYSHPTTKHGLHVRLTTRACETVKCYVFFPTEGYGGES